jgi:UDP-N-acetylmuramoylalanine--D-glutamate ligase
VSGRFDGERAIVIGAGLAGSGAARALRAEGAQVVVSDAKGEGELASLGDLRARGIEVRAGGHDLATLEDATLVVVSPGIAPDVAIVREAFDRGLPVWGELELGARLCRVPYAGVTGTNGKTTVTALVEACALASGVDAVACGNIGRSFPEAAREEHELLVVEASSFQLAMQTSFHPRVSVLLNVAPDHLDWHAGYVAYAEAKARIHARQGDGDVHVGNRDDPAASEISGRAGCELRWFRSGAPQEGEVGYEDGELVARIDGEHRLGRVASDRPALREDAAAAAAVSFALGVDPAAAAAALAAFRPASHRGEEVAVVEGVRFVDDSKATNVHAAVAAIRGVDDAVLIAGGRAKGADLRPLRAEAGRLRAVVAIGEAASTLVDVFDGLTPTSVATSIEEAVREAFAAAGPGGTVLLAPACASWDQFRDYAERGDRFAAAARSLAREVAARG